MDPQIKKSHSNFTSLNLLPSNPVRFSYLNAKTFKDRGELTQALGQHSSVSVAAYWHNNKLICTECEQFSHFLSSHKPVKQQDHANKSETAILFLTLNAAQFAVNLTGLFFLPFLPGCECIAQQSRDVQ